MPRKRKSVENGDDTDGEYIPNRLSSFRGRSSLINRSRTSVRALHEKYKQRRLARSSKKSVASVNTYNLSSKVSSSRSNVKVLTRNKVKHNLRTRQTTTTRSGHSLSLEKRRSLRSASPRYNRITNRRKYSNLSKGAPWLRTSKVPPVVDVESGSEPEIITIAPPRGKSAIHKSHQHKESLMITRRAKTLANKLRSRQQKIAKTKKQMLTRRLRERSSSQQSDKSSSVRSKNLRSKPILKPVQKSNNLRKLKKNIIRKTMSLRNDSRSSSRVTRSATKLPKELITRRPSRNSEKPTILKSSSKSSDKVSHSELKFKRKSYVSKKENAHATRTSSKSGSPVRNLKVLNKSENNQTRNIRLVDKKEDSHNRSTKLVDKKDNNQNLKIDDKLQPIKSEDKAENIQKRSIKHLDKKENNHTRNAKVTKKIEDNEVPSKKVCDKDDEKQIRSAKNPERNEVTQTQNIKNQDKKIKEHIQTRSVKTSNKNNNQNKAMSEKLECHQIKNTKHQDKCDGSQAQKTKTVERSIRHTKVPDKNEKSSISVTKTQDKKESIQTRVAKVVLEKCERSQLKKIKAVDKNENNRESIPKSSSKNDDCQTKNNKISQNRHSKGGISEDEDNLNKVFKKSMIQKGEVENSDKNVKNQDKNAIKISEKAGCDQVKAETNVHVEKNEIPSQLNDVKAFTKPGNDEMAISKDAIQIKDNKSNSSKDQNKEKASNEICSNLKIENKNVESCKAIVKTPNKNDSQLSVTKVSGKNSQVSKAKSFEKNNVQSSLLVETSGKIESSQGAKTLSKGNKLKDKDHCNEHIITSGKVESVGDKKIDTINKNISPLLNVRTLDKNKQISSIKKTYSKNDSLKPIESKDALRDEKKNQLLSNAKLLNKNSYIGNIKTVEKSINHGDSQTKCSDISKLKTTSSVNTKITSRSETSSTKSSKTFDKNKDSVCDKMHRNNQSRNIKSSNNTSNAKKGITNSDETSILEKRNSAKNPKKLTKKTELLRTSPKNSRSLNKIANSPKAKKSKLLKEHDPSNFEMKVIDVQLLTPTSQYVPLSPDSPPMPIEKSIQKLTIDQINDDSDNCVENIAEFNSSGIKDCHFDAGGYCFNKSTNQSVQNIEPSFLKDDSSSSTVEILSDETHDCAIISPNLKAPTFMNTIEVPQQLTQETPIAIKTENTDSYVNESFVSKESVVSAFPKIEGISNELKTVPKDILHSGIFSPTSVMMSPNIDINTVVSAFTFNNQMLSIPVTSDIITVSQGQLPGSLEGPVELTVLSPMKPLPPVDFGQTNLSTEKKDDSKSSKGKEKISSSSPSKKVDKDKSHKDTDKKLHKSGKSFKSTKKKKSDKEGQKVKKDTDSQKNRKEGESSKSKNHDRDCSKSKKDDKDGVKSHKKGSDKYFSKVLKKELEREHFKFIKKDKEKSKHSWDEPVSTSSKLTKRDSDRESSKSSRKESDRDSSFSEKIASGKSSSEIKKDKSSKKLSPKKKRKRDLKKMSKSFLFSESGSGTKYPDLKEFKRRSSSEKSQLKKLLSKAKRRKKLELLKDKKLSKKLSSKLLRKYAKKKGIKLKKSKLKLKKKDLKKENSSSKSSSQSDKSHHKTKKQKHKNKSEHKKDNNEKINNLVRNENCENSVLPNLANYLPEGAVIIPPAPPLPLNISATSITESAVSTSTLTANVIAETAVTSSYILENIPEVHDVAIDAMSNDLSQTLQGDLVFPGAEDIQSLMTTDFTGIFDETFAASAILLTRDNVTQMPLQFVQDVPPPKTMTDAATNTSEDDLTEPVSVNLEPLKSEEASVGTQTMTPVCSPLPVEMKMSPPPISIKPKPSLCPKPKQPSPVPIAPTIPQKVKSKPASVSSKQRVSGSTQTVPSVKRRRSSSFLSVKRAKVENAFNPAKKMQLSELSGLVDAPVYHPTLEEFQDPLEYIAKIQPEAEKYGICKIVPPDSFKPECKVNDDMRFTAHNQYVHKMLNRWGPNVQNVMCIKKHLKSQDVTLDQAPLIGGIELDLSKFYNTVQQFGGLQQVIEKKKWQKVADSLHIPKAAQDRVTKLYDAYCKYLVSYETLPNDEKKKLLDEVIAEHDKRIKSRNESKDESEDEEENNDCVTKGRSTTLSNFYRVARNTMNMWHKNEITPEEVESQFWKLVKDRQQHVVVHAGNIDSSVYQSGFPSNRSNAFAKHPWNLKILTNNPNSILRCMGPVSGVTIPTLHVGMLFTTGCWYRDPHSLPWIEYLHTGASKIWYGIPSKCSGKFRDAMIKVMPEFCGSNPVWLASDTAMVPPDILVKHGAFLSRTIQDSGQFIVIFPESFTSTICSGYCVSESVYFAPTSWLDLAQKAFKDIMESCEPPSFSLERLLFSVANDSRTSLPALQRILPMVRNIKNEEVNLRKSLNDAGLKQSDRLPLLEVKDKKDKKKKSKSIEDELEQECETCRTHCYVSMVVNIQEDTIYCLQHALEHIPKKDLKSCKLSYTYDEDELQELVRKIEELIEMHLKDTKKTPKKKIIKEKEKQ